MQLSKDNNNAKYQITKYTASSVTVNNEEFTSSILVMPEQVMPWSVRNVRDLSRVALKQIIEIHPEIVLLGTGAELVFPDPAVLQELFMHKIGVEIMTNSAACRTYAALTSEGRNVLAALVIG